MLMINKIFKRLKNKEHAISIIIIAVIFGFLIVSVVAQALSILVLETIPKEEIKQIGIIEVKK